MLSSVKVGHWVMTFDSLLLEEDELDELLDDELDDEVLDELLDDELLPLDEELDAAPPPQETRGATRASAPSNTKTFFPFFMIFSFLFKAK